MRKQLAVITAAAFVFGAPWLWAQEHGEHAHGGSAAAPAKTTEIRGQLIDLACYLKHDSKGDTHKTCAQECAAKGLPIGILTDDGKIYQVMGKGHESLLTVNAPLVKYMETKVTAVGEVFEKNGERVIAIEKIKAQ